MGESKHFIYGCIVTFLQIIIMTVSRAHYCIDVIFGFVVSHYCFIIVNDYEKIINRIFTCFISEKKEENKFLQEANFTENTKKIEVKQMKIIYE